MNNFFVASSVVLLGRQYPRSGTFCIKVKTEGVEVRSHGERQ